MGKGCYKSREMASNNAEIMIYIAYVIHCSKRSPLFRFVFIMYSVNKEMPWLRFLTVSVSGLESLMDI